jgi:hypothetical protein
MKKVLLALGIVFASGAASAQYINPNPFVYAGNPGGINTDDEQPYAFYTSNNIPGYTEILPPASTGWSSPVTIPFPFEFDGGVVTSYQAAATGVVSFSSNVGAAPSSANVDLPTTSIPDSSICAWGLTLAGGNDAVINKTFGNAPNRQHWVIWASASSPDNVTWAYWAIVLEETTNNIYIVDMRTFGNNVSLTLGVQVDQSTFWSWGDNVQSLNTATGGNSDINDNSYWVFNAGPQPDYDVNNLSVDVDNYYLDGSSMTIEGTIENLGAQTVNSLTVEYSVDGGAPVSGSVNGLNIQSFGTGTYTLTAPWTASLAGAGPLEFQDVETIITEVNGNVDSDPSNNTALKTVGVHVPATERKPMLEQITSSTCPPCLPGNANVLAILANYPDLFSKVNYQADFPGAGDPYYTLEGGARRAFYGINSIPSMQTDGSLAFLNSNSYTTEIFEDALAVPAFTDLTTEGTVTTYVNASVVDGAIVLDTTYRVKVSATISPLVDLPAGLRLQMSVQEDLTFNNVETNGETEFHDVLKKMIPNENGTVLAAISSGSDLTVTDSFSFQSAYILPPDAGSPVDLTENHTVEEWDDLRVASWVQDFTTGEIWQSENASITEVAEPVLNWTEEVVDGTTIYTIDGVEYEDFNGVIAPLGTTDLFGATVSVFPNPAKDVLNVTGVSSSATVAIYDAMGRLVRNQAIQNNGINVSDLNTGVYNLVIVDGEQRTTKRVSVIH